MNKKKLKYGGFSLLITLLFLTAIVLLNVFAGMLTERFFLKADLTETGLYSLSDKAAEVLSGVSETVDIIVLSEESLWHADSSGLRTRIIDILQNYSAVSGGRLRVQYVNPDLNSFDGPEYNNSLSVLKDAYSELEGLQRDDIIIKSVRRATRVPAASLFTVSYDDYGNSVATGIRADQELISALLYVLSEKVAGAVFIEGHREDSAERLKWVFDKCGYAISTINLALQDIPDDTVVVVSSAPKTDFLSGEIEKLEHYLSNGGNAMIFYDLETLSLPLLDGFLAQWGLSVDSKLVCDEQYSYFSQLNFVTAPVKAGMLPSLAGAEASGVPVAILSARPIRSEWAGGTRGNFTAFPLIETYSSSSYTKDYGGGGIASLERESGDEAGPFALAYNVRQITYDANSSQVHSHLIVSSIGLVDDMFLTYYGQYFYNIQLIADLANDLNPFGESVYIPSKQFGGEAMPVSTGQTQAVLILMVIALPLAIILAGILVWRKRRHQ
ncbi:MAG: GldG family protein [Oscillospiraceae bacterium]|jgi:ABC-2 type transport system permease protein|nr:GldG family protein [Oscillospiraceae bacterium]